METDETSRIVGKALTGTGLLAVFCDLAPEWRGDFRPWLAEDMFPPRMAIGFGPAASFDLIPAVTSSSQPTPNAEPQTFVTCYVTPSLGDLYGTPYQNLRTKRAPRDAAYHQRMENPARYTGSWVGPGIESGDRSFASIMVIDRFNLEPADIQGFNIWYAAEFLPACAAIPGLKRLRRYLAMESDVSHLVTYEFDEESHLHGKDWQTLRASSAWRLCRFAAGAPAAYRKVIDGAAG